jgi:transposase
MGQITVFSGPERRRRWSDEQRLQILTEAFSPDANVTEVARRHDVSTALIYTWRRKLCEARAESASPDLPATGFAEAVMIEDDGGARASTSLAIVVDLARGRRVSIFASASSATVAAVLKVLR